MQRPKFEQYFAITYEIGCVWGVSWY